jgi:hypothetical protein
VAVLILIQLITSTLYSATQVSKIVENHSMVISYGIAAQSQKN